jgi:cyclase
VGVRVTSEGVILVDDKYPQNFEEIQRLVRSVTELPVRYVLNTHHHGDHSGGNAQYLPLAEVIAHRNARDNMVRGGQDGLAARRLHRRDLDLPGRRRGEGLPHGHRAHERRRRHLLPRPAHRARGRPAARHRALHRLRNGGSSKGWVATINNILALPFDAAIPGHGAVMDRDDVTAFRNQMEAVRARMADLVRSGMPAGEAPTRIRSPALSWTQAEQGLFMQRSIPGFYEEIAAEVRQ